MHKLHKIVDKKHDKMSEVVVAMVSECGMSPEPFGVRGMAICAHNELCIQTTLFYIGVRGLKYSQSHY